MTKEDRLILAQTKADIYNKLHPEIEKWVLLYWKALKEIWTKPIQSAYTDQAILASYGLGTIGSKFEWNWKIKELDQKLNIKF